MNVSPSSLSLEGILEGYSDCTPVASEARKVFNGEELGTSLGGTPEGYSDCTLVGIRGKQDFNGEELDISQGCHQVYPWCISTPPQW